MRPRQVQIPPLKEKTLVFTGGLNEQIGNLELGPGELTDCLNYEEVDGLYHGYRSWPGFERWDGSVRTIEFPTGSGKFIDVGFASEVPVRKSTKGVIDLSETFLMTTEDGFQVITEDGLASIITEEHTGDAEREERRASIEPVPGTGLLLYCGFYKGVVYAIREDFVSGNPTGFVKCWYMEVGTVGGTGGWLPLREFPTDVLVNPTTIGPWPHTDPQVYNPPYRDCICKFAEWPASDPNTKSLCLCNGLYSPIMIHRNYFGDHTVTVIEDPNLPQFEKPTFPHFFENRLYLVYPKGHLFFSNLGDITFDPIIGFAGEFFFGAEITDMVTSVGSAIIVWMDKGIKIIKKIEIAQDGNPVMQVETFSEESSSIPMTATRFLGTMLFADDRGVSTIEAVEAFGDFSSSSVSKRVQRTYQENIRNILGAIGVRKKNQYIIIFRSGDGLSITFDIEKKVKGATYFDTGHTVTCFNQGIDHLGDDQVIFGDAMGYVQYSREEAQSFDGKFINTRMETSYFHYGPVTLKKNFKKMLMEVSGQKGVQFNIGVYLDYKDKLVPKGGVQTPYSQGAGDLWAEAIWSKFTWSGAVIDVMELYITAFGTNMSIAVSTQGKYHRPHIVHNATISYSNRGQDF